MTEEGSRLTRIDLTWNGGGRVEIVSLSAGAMVVRSETPQPPGSRPEGKTKDGEAVKMKVHGGRREADGIYRIEGRPLDMPRDLRERLTARLVPPSSG